MLFILVFVWATLALVNGAPQLPLRNAVDDSVPVPPTPEKIEITTLPLPPAINNTTAGACTLEINPSGTGCTALSTGLQGGSFLPDGQHVLATVRFVGAPAAPDPASVYTGQQVIIVKANGEVFSSGDAWKCITCGVPAAGDVTDFSYPQVFSDGKRVLAGAYIIDCGPHQLHSNDCTRDQTSVHPIRLENTADGSGPGARIRELRLHPDNLHLGLNVFDLSGGSLGQIAYIGRLAFNPDPQTGSNRAPRYDLTHVQQLFDPDAPSPLQSDGSELYINHSAITIGELRGFSGPGDEVTYIGYPAESCNIDVFAASLSTGRVRRLTSHPGYVDPIQMSPDDEWMVIMDTRGTNRTMFMDGLRGVPPITDMISATACSSVRNNGDRRFFQPWLLDRHGDRGSYFGQEINGASHGTAGSGAIDDPEWNGRADPWFSPDGTKITYWQAQTVPPACGGRNALPCYESKEPHGRHERLMVAHLVDRKPVPRKRVAGVPDIIPGAVKYRPGASMPSRSWPPPGKYVLKGRTSGHADVDLSSLQDSTSIDAVAVTFTDFSEDGLRIVSGSQNISRVPGGLTLDRTVWHSDITQRGIECGSQKTSCGGFHLAIDVMKNIFEANGTLRTTVDEILYEQPGNGM